MKDEIIIYQADEASTRLEVRIGEETVWLNRQQISTLFDRDVKTIGKHINNVFDEKELEKSSTVANFATVQNEGGRSVSRTLLYYNLDMIISIGYYHIGASLKDLGKKPVVSGVESWFAFSIIDIEVEYILKRLNAK